MVVELKPCPACPWKVFDKNSMQNSANFLTYCILRAMGSLRTLGYLVGPVLCTFFTFQLSFAEERSAQGDCTTFAGNLVVPASTIIVCEDEAVHFVHQADQVLDGDDLFQYILHSKPLPEIGEILSYSYETFFFKPFDALVGETYYISVAAGSHAGGNQIDFQDTCLSVRGGIPVRYDAVSIDVIAATDVCINDCLSIDFELKGVPPFTVDYQVISPGGTLNLEFNSPAEDANLQICPTDLGISPGPISVRVIAMADVQCKAILANPILLPITVHGTSEYILSEALCQGEYIDLHGERYDESNPSGTVVLPGAAQSGCDSIISVDLEFVEAREFDIVQTICQEQSIVVNNIIYDSSNPNGLQILEGQAKGGCDSVISVELSFYPEAFSDLQIVLCPGETFLYQGVTYSEELPAGVAILSSASHGGCDSTIYISLEFLPEPAEFLELVLCNDDFVEVNGEIFDIQRPSGTTTLDGAGAAGCDSIIHVDLTFFTPSDTTVVQTLQPGQSIEINGTTYDASNPNGIEVLTDANGCDSTVIVQLSFSDLNVTFSYDDITCSGVNDGLMVIHEVPGASAPFYVSVNGGDYSQYASLPITLETLPSGEYLVELRDNNDLTGMIAFEIADAKSLNLTAPTNVLVEERMHVQLQVQADFEVVQWSWTPALFLSCDDCSNPDLRDVDRDVQYIVTAEDVNGCEVTTAVDITFLPALSIYVPNVFTPNGDGQNDALIVQSNRQDFTIHHFSVFSRSGSLVFESIFGDVSWDGSHSGAPLPSGVYVYRLDAADESGEVRTSFGDITLLR